MTAAFDWSPGGCCCLPPGIGEIYNIQPPLPAGLVRYSSISPGTHSAPDWLIPNTHNAESRITLAPDLGTQAEKVWTVEGQWAALYDAVAKTMPMQVSPTVIPGKPAFVQGFAQWLAVSETEMVTFSGGGEQATGQFRRITAAGGQESYNTVARFWTNGNEAFGINAAAKRNWPLVAGSRIENQFVSPQNRDMFFGPAVLVNNNTSLRVNARTTVTSFGNCNAAAWLSFDGAADHWIGTLVHQHGTPQRTVEAWINGTRVFQVSYNHVSGFPPDDNYVGEVHVSHPAESNGQRYYSVAQRTNVADPRGWRLVVYNANGVEQWRSGPTAKCFVATSSDRWMYVAGQFRNGEMPNPFVTINGLDAPLWLVKHDGSQSYPSGIGDGTNPVSAWPGYLGGEPWGNPASSRIFDGQLGYHPGYCDVVKNSVLVGQPFPATAQEFADHI